MKILLDTNYIPYLKLLNHLYRNSPTGSIRYFSTELNLERRTIIKTIENLMLDITENNWQDMLTLEFQEGELTATIGPLFSLDVFYSHYMSLSFSVELALYIFKNPTATIEEILDYFYISQATFYRRLPPLKQVLADFNLELNFANKQATLLGEEKQIRYFYFILFWENLHSFPANLDCLNTKDKKNLETFYAHYQISIPLTEITEIHIEIALFRLYQGFTLTEFPLYLLPLIYCSRIDFYEHFIPFFQPLNLSENQLTIELGLLYFSFVTATIYSPTIAKNIPLYEIPWTFPTVPHIHKWVNYYIAFFKAPLSNEEYVYLLLNLYLIQLKFEVWTGGSLSVGINTVEEILHYDNPYILIQTNLFFDFLNQQEKEYFLTPFQKMSYTLLIRRLIATSKPALNILICSKVGQEQNDWLAHFVLKISTIPVHIHSAWQPNLDLIITDHALSASLIPDNLDHYFMWSAFPKPLEWTQLLQRLEKLYYNKFLPS